jgi:putative oxidoreductase
MLCTSATTDASDHFRLMASPDLLNTALLLLRVFFGLLLAAHGILKVVQGGGLEAEAAILQKDGLGGGKPAAAFSAVVQVGSGTLLAVGLLTPLAGAGAIGAMVVAVLAKARNGFWVPDDGLEFPLVFAVMAVVATLAGPGEWSLDHVAGLAPTTTETLVGMGAGLVVGALTFPLLRRPHPTNTTHASSDSTA